MKNIFENAKFGDHFTFDGDDCIFLQQISESNEEDGSDALYELAVHKHINFTDGSQKDYVRNIRVHPDGFAYAVDEEDGSTTKLYVTKLDDYEEQFEEIERLWNSEYGNGKQYCHKESFSWGFQEGVDWYNKK